jgi:hypothetical protein
MMAGASRRRQDDRQNFRRKTTGCGATYLTQTPGSTPLSWANSTACGIGAVVVAVPVSP